MLKKLVHSKSDQNFFEKKNIIDDITRNMHRIKKNKKKKVTKQISPFNSAPSTPTSSSSYMQNSEPVNNVHSFFAYLLQILNVKREFEQNYFNRYVLPAKIFNNILITYLKEYAKLEFTRLEINPQLISEFEEIITITNSITPESLFTEIRTRILVAFERVQLKIKDVYEMSKTNFSSESQMLFFNMISHTIFFVLSNITYRVDYYSFAMNRLIEKMNKFIDMFLDNYFPEIGIENDSNSNNSNEYNHCLRFIQKYIQIKLKFIDEFYQEGSRYTKFNSLGRFLFNNLNEFLMIFNELPSKANNDKKHVDTLIHWIHFKAELHYTEDSSIKLSTYFSMFFNSRLAKWKNDFFHPLLILGEDKEEICRICEQRIKLHHYYLHIYYCLNYVISFQELKKNKKSIKKHLNKIDQLTNKEYNKEISTENNNTNNKNKIQDLLIQTENDRNCPFDLYENDSNQCFCLLALINEIMLSCINNNSNTNDNSSNLSKGTSSLMTRRILQLVSLLLKRFKIVVDILTLKEMRTKNKMSYCVNHYARLSSLIKKNMSNSTQDTSKKIDFDHFSFKNTIPNNGFLKSNDFTSQKVKQSLNELKSITKDELCSKTVTKSKFCQSFNTNSNVLNYNNTMQETTIEIYPDPNQDQNDSPKLVVISKISDFVLICPIAKGGYGRVDLYKKATTGDYFAIKTVYLDSMVSNA